MRGKLEGEINVLKEQIKSAQSNEEHFLSRQQTIQKEIDGRKLDKEGILKDKSVIDEQVAEIEKTRNEAKEKLLTVQKAIEELNKPRYMNVKYIFDTVDKEIKIMTADDLDVHAEELGLKGSPTKVKKSMTKEAKGAGEIVKESAPEAVAYVLGKLQEKHYI